MLKSIGRTKEAFVMRAEGWPQAGRNTGGTPCAVKAACTVWSRGKSGVSVKGNGEQCFPKNSGTVNTYG